MTIINFIKGCSLYHNTANKTIQFSKRDIGDLVE